MTLATCKSLCSQYKYYGVEYGGECYCGNSLATPGGAGGDGQGTFGTVVSSSQCSTPCPGGPSQTTCGGPWRVWIDTVTPSITGCYVDNSQRVLNYKASVDYGSMTLATCKSLCSQYKYYGVEYGGECYCGNSLATPGGAGGDGQGTFGTVVSSSQCSTPCPGGPSQTTCGGPWRVWVDTVA
ncbi:uncharacterized protein BJ171DRAFT_113233 [Polychytrium aggregatum]|uniref:uncharacterized protein n=1 Tax=Polychytrium aggregatum TaxID=110093 RepID=UPI0022FE28E3|nr:uncharacterized protein BJ171DRAFT_113233 [Polychytrium aggregatum]KAI9209320.1 hypothetical protein BJ171DRAFT_113233 [Polychytrium aggregatum]